MVVNDKYIEDYNMVHKYLLGNDEAGKELYSKTYPIVKRYIANNKNSNYISEEDKEDILDDAMMESVRKLEYYNGTSAFSTYVCGIACNKILENIRSNANENQKKKIKLHY